MKTKSMLILLTSVIMHVAAFSQLAVKKQSDVGGIYSDGLTNICLSKDGGLLAAGISDSDTGQYKKSISKGGFDYWIVKYIQDNTKVNYIIQWDKSIGGDSMDNLGAAVSTSDGGYLLAGSSASGKSGDKTQPGFGQEDYWIVKLDGDGNIEWDKTIGTIYSDYIKSVDVTKDGGYILLGSLGLTKLDNMGNVQWQSTNNIDPIGSYRSVKQIKNGGYLIAGIYHDEKHGWYPKMVKTDSMGNVRASRGYPSDAFKQYSFNYYSARQTPDGGALLYGLANIDSTKINLSAADIIKTDALGNVQWRHITTGFDSFYTQTYIVIEPTADGGYLFGGTTQDQDVSGGGGQDFRFEKLDALGNTQWVQLIGGKSTDILFDLKKVGADKYIAGSSSDSPRGRDKTTKNLGSGDYWIIGLADTTNHLLATNKLLVAPAGTASKKVPAMFVYPNPAKNIIHIQTKDKTTVSLMDQSGRIILTKKIINNDVINASSLPPGLYYIKNTTTGEIQKLIITR